MRTPRTEAGSSLRLRWPVRGPRRPRVPAGLQRPTWVRADGCMQSLPPREQSAPGLRPHPARAPEWQP